MVAVSGWGQTELTAAARTRIHAALLGPPDAADIVCVHGLGCSHRYFLPLARQLSLDCGPRRLVETFRFLLADPVEHKLRHIDTPAVVVRGSRDPIASRAWVRECVAQLPDGRRAEVPGAGHTLNYSAPAEPARITCSLLDRKAGGPR